MWKETGVHHTLLVPLVPSCSDRNLTLGTCGQGWAEDKCGDTSLDVPHRNPKFRSAVMESWCMALFLYTVPHLQSGQEGQEAAACTLARPHFAID